MLYTTYFAKMKDIPDDCLKLVVTRFPPKWLDIKKYPDMHIAKSLSPSQELLLEYKKNNDWEWYAVEFYEETDYRKDMVEALRGLSDALHKGRNICLMCYEKDYTRCHRSLLGQYFAEEGIEWREL